MLESLFSKVAGLSVNDCSGKWFSRIGLFIILISVSLWIPLVILVLFNLFSSWPWDYTSWLLRVLLRLLWYLLLVFHDWRLSVDRRSKSETSVKNENWISQIGCDFCGQSKFGTAKMVPFSYSHGRSAFFTYRLHDFYVTVCRCLWRCLRQQFLSLCTWTVKLFPSRIFSFWLVFKTASGADLKQKSFIFMRFWVSFGAIHLLRTQC